MVAEVRSQRDTERRGARGGQMLGVGTTENARKWLRQAEIDDSGVSRGGGVGNQPSSDR